MADEPKRSEKIWGILGKIHFIYWISDIALGFFGIGLLAMITGILGRFLKKIPLLTDYIVFGGGSVAIIAAFYLSRRPEIEILSPGEKQDVEFEHTVRILVRRSRSIPFQVLIFSGDKLWHLQTTEVSMDGSILNIKCQFGDKENPRPQNNPTGEHIIQAILGDKVKGSVIKNLPRGVIKSKPVQVFRKVDSKETQTTVKRYIGEINFNYLPGTPMEHGWEIVEGQQGTLPKFSIDHTCPDHGALQITHSDTYAMDYCVDQSQSMADFIELYIKFARSSAFYFKVKMSSKDGSSNSEGWLCYKPEYSEPGETAPNHEWGVPIQGDVLSGGWINGKILLIDDVRKTFGKKGWVYRNLISVRLRGSLSVSPIIFYRVTSERN